MKPSYVPASLLFCCILLFGISSASLADGFDNRYEVRYGDFNGDGQTDDLFVRQQPRIVLIHGDVSIPILIRGDVEAFVLRHNGNGTFTLVTGLSSSQRTTFSGWPQADVVHMSKRKYSRSWVSRSGSDTGTTAVLSRLTARYSIAAAEISPVTI